MFPVASPKGSVQPGPWDLQEFSAGGEGGGEQGLQPAPWGPGVTKSCLCLLCWEWLEGFLVLQSHLASKNPLPCGAESLLTEMQSLMDQMPMATDELFTNRA